MEKENFTRIDAYLSNELPPQEKLDFEKAIAADNALAKEVTLHRLEKQAVRKLVKNKFKEKIKQRRAEAAFDWDQLTSESTEDSENISSEKTAKIVTMRPMRRALSIAAAGLVFFLAGTLWWSNVNYGNENLSARGYFEAASAGNKSGVVAENPVFQGGLQAFFETKDDAQAIAQFSAIPPTDGNYLLAQYYLGNSYLRQKEYTASIAAFEKVLRQTSLPPFISRDEVRWNQLLAFVGNGETENATFQKNLADLAANGQRPFRQKAQKLQADLSVFWRKLVF